MAPIKANEQDAPDRDAVYELRNRTVSRAVASTAALEQLRRSFASPFFSLPLEVRSMIYDIIFCSEDHDFELMMTRHPWEDWRGGKSWVTRSQWRHRRAITNKTPSKPLTWGGPSPVIHRLPTSFMYETPSLLVACRQLWEEASPNFYRLRTVYTDSLFNLDRDLRPLTLAQRNSIFRLRIMRRLPLASEDARLPQGDKYGWDGRDFTMLQGCQNLRHLTVELGFFWPYLDTSRQLRSLQTLRGLHSLTFLGNDGQPTRHTKKGSYVQQQGLRPDLLPVYATGARPPYQNYEVDPEWAQSIRSEVLKPRRVSYKKATSKSKGTSRTKRKDPKALATTSIMTGSKTDTKVVPTSESEATSEDDSKASSKASVKASPKTNAKVTPQPSAKTTSEKTSQVPSLTPSQTASQSKSQAISKTPSTRKRQSKSTKGSATIPKINSKMNSNASKTT